MVHERAKSEWGTWECSLGRAAFSISGRPFPNESETILAPGTFLKVRSQSNPAENFHIVDCEQIEPEEPMNNASVGCLM
ncbi:unnamed protein product [Didymodactylos carnosus]|uniref:Uncharacterized protein n=1 Tax=Didymodactylos carnosus TaxID=1234261 RepID=A0A8S2GDF3_9BILA|nr:unnamed protein product [Didymodactylos carnosus]CAF3896155.1 unnamed protein product [Didymodactylos carnosus]